MPTFESTRVHASTHQSCRKYAARLIRLRELVDDLLHRDPKAKLPNDHDWLLRRLAKRTRPAGVVDDRGLEARQRQWARWLAGDKALLLLDGLDEVADLALRDRVLAIVRSACESDSLPRTRSFGNESSS